MLRNRQVFKERTSIPLMPRHVPSRNGYKQRLRVLILDRGSTQIIGKPLRHVRGCECESDSVLCCCSLVFNYCHFSSMSYVFRFVFIIEITASDDWTKEVVVTHSRYYRSICLEGLEKTAKILIRVNRCPGWCRSTSMEHMCVFISACCPSGLFENCSLYFGESWRETWAMPDLTFPR
jgi:hypothetical protein